MDRRRWLLAFGGPGTIAVALGVLLSTGISLTVGSVFLAFGAAAVLWWPVIFQSAIRATLPVVGFVFLFGALQATWSPDPAFGFPLTTGHPVVDGAVYVSAFAPVLGAFVAATLHDRDRERAALARLFGTLVGGWFAAALLVSLQRGHSGFISAIAFGVVGLSFLAASAVIVLANGVGSVS
jgi:hypothetical protein